MTKLNGKLCFLCSAWHASVLPEFKNYGYCHRYDMKTHASEWCETCDIVHEDFDR